MDKKLIIVLLAILFALIGIIFIISLIISGNPFEGESKIEQENTPQIKETIDSELLKLKIVIENVKMNKGGYEHLYDSEDFLNSINELKAMGAVNIVSNIDPLSQTYCLALLNSENNVSSCIDNNFIGNLESPACGRDNIACEIPQNEDIPENIEEIVDESDNITEEGDVEENIEEEEVLELILLETVTVKDTIIEKYKNNEGKEIIFINKKEFGPYNETFIVHNETDWGISMDYNGSWYVNINGKPVGPYVEKPIIEFYDESLGFSYIKNNKYYVAIGTDIYGPYGDLSEFNLNNN